MGKAIGNETRYRIFEALMKGPRTVGHIADLTDTAQPTVSQHLRVLKEAEMVIDERYGQEILYTINVAYMSKLLKKLADDVARGQK